MAARVRWTGSTTSRGYGHVHQSERERRLARYRPGDPCAHCGQPITWWPLTVARRYIDLPHTSDRGGYLPGLAHRYCNRRDGQARTTAILNARRGRVMRVGAAPLRTSRRW
jgi:hypothetical protein